MSRSQVGHALMVVVLAAGPACAQVSTIQSTMWSMARRAVPLVLVILALFATLDIGAMIFTRVLRRMGQNQLR